MKYTIDLATINDRFNNLQALECEKLNKAYEIMSLSARKVISLLPIILHFNHPVVPGFRNGSIPYGIDGFTPSIVQKEYLDKLFDGTHYDIKVADPKILALYAMGSTSSLGQGYNSDFDIWVCVKKDLDQEALALLSEKCNFISVYAKAKGVDLNLFITPEDKFSKNNHDNLDSDNCGSAQNLFLLDEFYRSAIRLSGRYLLWYIISTQEELDDYEAYKKQILSIEGIDKNQWFDFGKVVNSSPNEYFGSGLWLLYKGIASPFKAAIKILLMEVYANEYPNTSLLSSELKDRVLNNEKGSLLLDPYFALFKKVSDYLNKINDTKRLELVQLCFYFKIYHGLKGINNANVLNYRLSFLKRLAKNFNWNKERLNSVEDRDRWKIAYVRKLNKQLLYSLITSYRALLSFSIKHGIEYAITSDDAGILSRRLYAAYDRYPSKILVFNSELSLSLKERYLTFIYPHHDTICRKQWYLYACASNDINMLAMPLAYSSSNICEVIAWACFNKLITNRTENFVICGTTKSVTNDKIKSLSSDIMRLVYPSFLQPGNLDMQRPRELLTALIVLNFEVDATELNTISEVDVEFGNTLSSGKQKLCLIGSIDMILVNSWGELLSLNMPDGEDGVVELLATLVRFAIDAKAASEMLKSIKVMSYAKSFKELLRFDLESLIKKIFQAQQNNQDVIFEIGHNTYVATNSLERGILITKRNAFGQDEYDISILSRYGMRPEFALQVPALVDRYATVGVIQYFFVPIAAGWDIYVLNERNEVSITQGYTGSRANLVNSINRYYTELSDGVNELQIHFNLPQYFVLSKDLKSIHPFTIRAN